MLIFFFFRVDCAMGKGPAQKVLIRKLDISLLLIVLIGWVIVFIYSCLRITRSDINIEIEISKYSLKKIYF